MSDTLRVDAAAHYRHLAALGRDEFLASAAAAALVRFRTVDPGGGEDNTRTSEAKVQETIQETLPHSKVELGELALELFPLVKKSGASFPDRITIGRTSNNDVVIPDPSISRFHAYVRQHAGAWVVADAGSKNGSSLRGAPLEPRKEQPVPSRAVLRLGDVDLTFYVAVDLYAALGGAS